MKPEASIVIPVYQRTSTLRAALQSVQNQTIRNIEIVIVLDGASDPCKQIINSFSSADERFTVFDLPKGQGAGKDNLDYAVSRAKADKIFYSDDDDLLLPFHIEKLAPLLDEYDIVDSRVCTLDINGGLHLTPCPGNSLVIRQLLQAGKLKMLFDTHVAHRKSAYGKFARWRGHAKYPYGPVWSFLAEFCESQECRWGSIEEVTAISIHGAVRKHWSVKERTEEIEAWYKNLQSHTDKGQILARGRETYYLFQLLFANPANNSTLEAYLSAINSYSDLHLGEIEYAMFKLFIDRADVFESSQVVEALSQPVVAGYLFEQLAQTIVKQYGHDFLNQVALELEQQSMDTNSLAGVYAFIAAANHYAGQKDKALEKINQAIQIGPDPVGHLQRFATRLAEVS